MTKIPEPLFVLEIANNHMGDIRHGLRLIDEYSQLCKSFKKFKFAFKFQYRDLDTFIHPELRGDLSIPYVKRFEETRLSQSDFDKLVQRVKKNGFYTMVTPFDNNSLKLIEKQDIDIIKVASCSFGDWPLLEGIVNIKKPLILSTAGSSTETIDSIVFFLKNRQKDFALMHCIAEYPTPNANLHLSQINYLKNRYNPIRIGYSTHESPNDFANISIAIAKGASIFEKHVALPTTSYPKNKYSVDLNEFYQWLKTAEVTYKICGEGKKRYSFSELETQSLHSLRRGIFAKKKINKGDKITEKDIFFAFPPRPKQYTANDYSKYNSFFAKKDILKNEGLFLRNTELINSRSLLEKIVDKTKKIIKKGNINLPNQIEMEVSHHYGLESFFNYGMVIFTIVNRVYCKKLLILQAGQKHPEQFHKNKEESFRLLYGDIKLLLNDKLVKLELGDLVTVEKGTRHFFESSKGAIIEEISSNHQPDDSFYTDKTINKNQYRKTILNFYND